MTAGQGWIALGLVIYLLYYQRSQRLTRGERLVSLILAVPAVVGVSFGMVRGQAVYAITGVSAIFSLRSRSNRDSILWAKSRNLSAPARPEKRKV